MKPSERLPVDVRVLRARLAAAGIAPPEAETVIIDLAGDPPLGGSAQAVALHDAERVVAGAGAAMLASGARRAVVAVGDVAAQQSVRAAAALLSAERLDVVRVPDLFPSVGIDRDLGCHYAYILDAEAVLDLEAAAFQVPRALRRVTLAGYVRNPGVLAVAEGESIEALVARAGGSTAPADAWVALDGGFLVGALADRESPPATALVLVLPAAHALAARARTTIALHLQRAASACEGCRACTESCPVYLDGAALEPHLLVRAQVQAGIGPAEDPSGGSPTEKLTASLPLAVSLDAALDCVGCGVCNAACPGGLAPGTLVLDLKERLVAERPPSAPTPPVLSPRLPAHPDREGRRYGRALLVLRSGLPGEGYSESGPVGS